LGELNCFSTDRAGEFVDGEMLPLAPAAGEASDDDSASELEPPPKIDKRGWILARSELSSDFMRLCERLGGWVDSRVSTASRRCMSPELRIDRRRAGGANGTGFRLGSCDLGSRQILPSIKHHTACLHELGISGSSSGCESELADPSRGELMGDGVADGSREIGGDGPVPVAVPVVEEVDVMGTTWRPGGAAAERPPTAIVGPGGSLVVGIRTGMMAESKAPSRNTYTSSPLMSVPSYLLQSPTYDSVAR